MISIMLYSIIKPVPLLYVDPRRLEQLFLFVEVERSVEDVLGENELFEELLDVELGDVDLDV